MTMNPPFFCAVLEAANMKTRDGISKTNRQDITEILLKMVLNTINQTKLINNCSKCRINFLLNYIVEGYSINVIRTHWDKDIRFHYKSRDHVHFFIA
jgi:hypothetical protein